MAIERKATLLRELNDEVRRMLQRFSAEDEGEFFCECPLALCARRVALAAHEYDAIRLNGASVAAPACPYFLAQREGTTEGPRGPSP